MVVKNNQNIHDFRVSAGYAVPYQKYLTPKQQKFYAAMVESSKKQQKGNWKDYGKAMTCLLENGNPE